MSFDLIKKLCALSAPLLLSQITIVLYGVIDTLLLSQRSTFDLGVLGTGHAIYLTIYVTLTSVIQSLIPIIAQLFGAKRYLDIRDEMFQAVFIALTVSLLGVILLWSVKRWLPLTKISPTLIEPVSLFLQIQSGVIIAAILFRICVCFHQAIGDPTSLVRLHLIGLIVKILLSIVLISGMGTFTGFGVIGSAISNVILMWFLLAAGIWSLRTHPRYRRFGFESLKIQQPNWNRIKTQLRIGIPLGVSAMLDVAGFSIMSVWVTSLGLSTIGAHQILSNIALLLFMIPLSLSIATQSMMGQSIGQANYNQCFKIAKNSFYLVIVMAGVIITCLYGSRYWIIEMYNPSQDVKNHLWLAFGLVCLYHLFDAIQVVGAAILRSFRIVIGPTLIYTIMMWCIGVPLGWWFLHINNWGLIGAWAGTTIGQGLAGLAFWVWVRVHLLRLKSIAFHTSDK